LLERARTHTARASVPVFNTPEEWQQWQRQEQAKTAAAILAQRQERKAQTLFNASCIPELHKNCGFDNYNATSKEQETVLKLVKYYADTFERQFNEGRCMMFHGTTGTGKNHLASALVNQVIADGYSAQILKVSDLMSRFKASYNRDSRITEEMISRELVAIDLLVLDEIGASHGSHDEVVQINRLIDNRVTNIKPTITLTNLTTDEFVACLGDRNVDRLRANNAPVLMCYWPSYRTGAANNENSQ
jgi:DNA replication protein DnaC